MGVYAEGESVTFSRSRPHPCLNPCAEPKLKAGNGSGVGSGPGGWDEASRYSGVGSPAPPSLPVSHLSQDKPWSLYSSLPPAYLRPSLGRERMKEQRGPSMEKGG